MDERSPWPNELESVVTTLKRRIIVALTLMAAGRAMTLAYIGRAGDGGSGDPPAAWLMPLVGDAFVGLAAIVVAALIVVRPSFPTWVVAVVWSSIGAFDALAAFLVELSDPWPSFFMLEIFGRSMFFVAAAMHVVIVVLLTRPDVKAAFGVGLDRHPLAAAPVDLL